MNIRYFITASATFVSIFVAQAATAGVVVTQKLVAQVSSKNLFSREQVSKPLGETLRAKFSSIDNNQGKQVVELVPVALSLARKGGFKSGKKLGRPRLSSRGPMSF
ncbi:hypothetical protein O93_00719 [Bartonella quintana JK 19]|uniref:hypothetical protein n=1 Tax=Bartonella quintana TaxID=803 RepID=UPI00049F71FE|nr:hypothetical protein [Bartonella quintana]KEC59388.1 hypothetical protein O93_00719 [Bartonella quintana JK 19]